MTIFHDTTPGILPPEIMGAVVECAATINLPEGGLYHAIVVRGYVGTKRFEWAVYWDRGTNRFAAQLMGEVQ